VALNLFNSVKLVGEGFAYVILLHSKHALEGFLISTEDLHLLLVSAKVFLKVADSVIQIVKLSLDVSGVI
jgi:hypothetical protein